ncbi:MAG TPA: heme o synthase [Actinomycetota bacterium]|nr:heme o synthase [Actinomycetota bacterium]
MQRLVSDAHGVLSVEEAVPTSEVVDATFRQRIAAYVALTKPRIIELLLVTTVPSMVLAAGGWPSTWLVIATLIGGTLSAGGANAINCFIDRDIDAVMPRTKRRPLPMHRIEPRNALIFGIVLGTIALAFLWTVVNPMAAVISTSALLFYVLIYTWVMKRATPQNIVIGGAAGAMPVLVGWSAVTGTIDLPALAMFGIIFYWTPPHFWALAMRYEKEYAAAGVPMMPVVYGKEETTKHILLYSFMQLALCLALFSVARMGMLYLASALTLNAVFIAGAVKLYRAPSAKKAWELFRFSIYFLALLFAAIALDVLI